MRHWKLIIILAVIAGSLIWVKHFDHQDQVSVQPQPEDSSEKLAESQPADQPKDQPSQPEGSSEKSVDNIDKEKSQPAQSAQIDSGKSKPVVVVGSKGVVGAKPSAPVQQVVASAKPGEKVAPSEKIVEKPKAPESNCFVYEFQHKPAARQKDIEDFLDYTNAFPIAHKDFNPKTVCVKVNHQAVAYKVIQNKGLPEALVGSVVGPESVIRVSYCIGKAMCKETCGAQAKRFMDDLVGEANAAEEFGDSWGEHHAKTAEQKKKLNAQVKEFRSVASENDSLTKQSVMRDWTTLNHQESVCKSK